MSEFNDGGFAERGNVVGSAGGLAQPGGSNTSSGGTGGNFGSSGSSQSQHMTGLPQTNFNSPFAVTGTRYATGPYGITPFAVPRRDQTLQDRQFGNLGSGMVGTSFGQGSGSGNSGSAQAPTAYQTVRRRNKRTGVVEEVRVPVPPTPPTPPLITNPPIPRAKPERDWGTNYGPAWGPGGVSFPTGNTGQYTIGGTTAYGGKPPNIGAGAGGQGTDFGSGRLQFGGPAESGGTYTVGENGPEMLQMAPGSQGHVTPMNPADRLGGMDPNMMRDMFQLQMQTMQNPLMGPQQMGQQSGQPPGRQLGGPQMDPNRPGWTLGTPGFVDPRTQGPRPPGRGGGPGFGLSGLGQSGILGQLRNRGGGGGFRLGGR